MNMTKEEYKKFLENLTDEEFNASIQRVSEAEFDQENPNFDKDKAILKAEKQRRTRSKNKDKPMGKKDGGMVKGYMGGGDVHMDDSPNSGMITTKGWGKSRAT